MGRKTRAAWKGFAAGMIGGALGTAVLTAFQKGSLEGTRVAEKRLTGKQRYTGEQEELLKSFETAHAIAAEKAAQAVGTKLSRSQRKKSPPVVEFAFGMLCAGVYGVMAEFVPEVTVGGGSIFGAVLFTGASEVVLPALGWVAAPADRTPVQHAGGLAGNVVYGLVTEGVRRGLRSIG